MNLKPFQKVLVRDNDSESWAGSEYSYTSKTKTGVKYVCTNGTKFAQCVPFEGNETLLGTTMPAPETKTWRVSSRFASFDEKFTDDELRCFIEIAVIKGRDVTHFYVNRID